MRFVLCLVLFAAATLSGVAQPSADRQVLVLGGLRGDAAAAVAALQAAGPLDSTVTILMPGNAVGDPGVHRYDVLDSVAGFVRGTGARAYLLPGPLEWAGGVKSLKAIEDHLDELPDRLIRMPLKKGCPGPETVTLGPDAVLILLDSEWWLQDEDRRPGIESDCDTRMPRQILDEVDDALTEAAGKTVLFAAAGSLHSTGIRSGYFGPRQHVFPLTDIRGWERAYLPLPVAGSAYPIARGLFTGHHDYNGRRYQAWAAEIEALLREHPRAVALGGSDPILQLYEDDHRYYLTSGAAHRGGRTTRTRHTPFTTSEAGFTRLTLQPGGGVTADFYTRAGSGFRLHTRYPLYDRTPVAIPPAEPVPAIQTASDSVTAAVHPSYNKASRTVRFILGENYRRDWATPVTLPVFYPAAERFSFAGVGGGNTTTAVRLTDSTGTTWSLRSILKSPSKVIPESFRATVAEDAVRDASSAAYPWAGLLAAGLSDAVGLPRPRLRYVYVPADAVTDSVLGRYGPAFASTVAMLEERGFSYDGGDTKGTWKVMDDALDGKPQRADAASLLRGRALDILLVDFDRHYAQWKWETRTDSAGRKRWFAIPKDRDQAFFHLDGLLARKGRVGQMQYLGGFRPQVRHVARLSFVARDIDTYFLNELDEQDWDTTFRAVQAALTDSAIAAAVHALPPALYAVRGPQFESILRQRRDELPQAGLDYYRFLARRVTVTGSNRKDSFDIAPAPDGARLAVWTWEKGTDTPACRYRRLLRSGETREVRLYGFGADDRFTVQPGVARGIRLRFVGGTGEDTFSVQSPARTWVYDAAGKGNALLDASARTTSMISHREDVNRYTFRGNDYNSTTLPTLAAGANPDDGPFLGLGASIQQRGFRVEPYKSRHSLSATVALLRAAFALRYNGVVNDVWRHYDLVAAASWVNPTLQNFFGLGNETEREAGRPISYYYIRYNTVSAEALVRKRFLDGRLSVAAGPTLFRYAADPDRAEGRVLAEPERLGLDPARVFRPLLYGGGRLRIDFNSLDQPLLPVRGARWSTNLAAMQGLDGTARPITRLESHLDVYAPLSSNERFVVNLRGGGGHIFSQSFEYFQALTLGAATGLRGYRKARFAGASSLYGGAELRWRALRLRSRLLPADLGLLGFAESGRVWMPGERSTLWHSDWGAGLYATPFNAILLSTYVAVSPDETLFNVSAGAGIGITF